MKRNLPILVAATLLALVPWSLVAQSEKAPTIADSGAWVLLTAFNAYSWDQPIERNTPTVQLLRKDTIISVVASFDGAEEDKIQSDAAAKTAPALITITTTALVKSGASKTYQIRGIDWSEAEKLVGEILTALKEPSDGGGE